MFSPERNLSEWQISGFKGGKTLIFQSIESTHTLMKELAFAGKIQPGSIIVADSQSSGHGRHERTWFSPTGKNLYFNILVPLDGIPAKNFAQITQVTALTFTEIFCNLQQEAQKSKQSYSIMDADSNSALPQITVKWPNDILCNESKFCGILAEILFLPGAKPTPTLNLGIGINVNAEPSDYAFLNRKVTTLKRITDQAINREHLLQVLISSLERAILQFKAFGISPWVDAWRRMDKFIGTRGTIIINNHCTDQNRNDGIGVVKKTGRIVDMQPNGSLLFETDDGIRQIVYSADLEI